MPAAEMPPGAGGCSTRLAALSANVNAVCCPDGGCANGVPSTCEQLLLCRTHNLNPFQPKRAVAVDVKGGNALLG